MSYLRSGGVGQYMTEEEYKSIQEEILEFDKLRADEIKAIEEQQSQIASKEGHLNNNEIAHFYRLEAYKNEEYDAFAYMSDDEIADKVAHRNLPLSERKLDTEDITYKDIASYGVYQTMKMRMFDMKIGSETWWEYGNNLVGGSDDDRRVHT